MWVWASSVGALVSCRSLDDSWDGFGSFDGLGLIT